jgi:DNA helicase II / ATP-dependent DNA helicase PcrA
MDELLNDLNPPQREAVCHTEGPLLVLAGAGSGKTRVLTYRIAYLVRKKGVQPGRILALTFTNKAAGEMKSRVERLLGGQTRLWIGTFHSIFARVLRRDADKLGYTQQFSIYDSDDSLRLVKKILKEMPQAPGTLTPNRVQHAISRYKNDLRTPEELAANPRHLLERKIAEVYALYQKELKASNAMDFDDLILKPTELFRVAPEVLQYYQRQFSHILIDEYQDTNRAQYNLVRALAAEHHNLCVVGDDDQSIYGWRGADIRNILEFERDFEGVTTIRLEQNYRSTGNILEVAHAVVCQNKARKPKKLWTERGLGLKAVVLENRDELDEASQAARQIADLHSRSGFNWRDIAVLYRTNAQSRALEDTLRRAVVPYRIIGGLRFYERKEIKDLMAYLKVIVNPLDSTSLYRIINVPVRGIGPTTLTRLTALANTRGEPLYHALADADQAEEVTQRIARAVMDLHTMFEDLRRRAQKESAAAVLTELIRLTQYEREFNDLETLEAQGRLENIAELVSAAEEFSQRFEPDGTANCLEAWLAETALISEVDLLDPDQDYVTLMTLHNAKGLEFPVVFIAGVEEHLLPIARSLEDETGAGLEEERRLFYVGITRAMQLLYLSWAASRRRYSDVLDSGPSTFLRDVPEELLDHAPSPRFRESASSFSANRFGEKETFPLRGPIGAAPPIGMPGAVRRKSAAAAARSASGPVFERDPGVDEPAWRKGERVKHQAFGSGTIVEVGAYLDDIRVTVQFDSGERKKLVARFARLLKE